MPKKEADKPEPKVPARSKPRYGLGHIVDLADERDWKARALLGAPRNLPLEAMQLEACLRTIKDQGPTESCVGHSIGTAVDVRLRMLGYVTPDFSRVQPYTMARILARTSPSEKLRDEGCFPRFGLKALGQAGIPFEDAWPLDPATINDEPPWDVYQKASPYRVSAYWRIDSTGQARVDEVCAALAKNLPVIFGATVGNAFMNWDGTGDAPIATPDDVVGGHMLPLTGYTTTPTGRRRLRGPNSWGHLWGNRGMFWVDEAFIADPRSTDFYVIQAEVRP